MVSRIKLPRVLRRVVGSLAMEAVLEAVRGYLQELLKDVTPEHVYQAIEEDADPWEYAPSRVRSRGRHWARKLRKYQDRLTPELVLKWLRSDRPDLASLIINSGRPGTLWLGGRTESIKLNLWPPLKGGLKLVEKPEVTDEVNEVQTPRARGTIRWG